MFFRIFQHLLPVARAWRVIVDKFLRQFFEGLAVGVGDVFKTFFDQIWQDIDPQKTREIKAYETQFGLPNTITVEQERRDRLDAAWKALGGQDPRYLQDTLQAAGFDVYVHEWWTPGSEVAVNVKSCVTPRNPLLVLRRSSVDSVFIVECNEILAQCGEALAQCGETLEPVGYPLVNKIISTTANIITQCGETLAQCGEPDASCGNFIQFTETQREYIVPTNVDKWPYFLYIGGSVYGDIAQVDPTRKNEFETLCLKICPAHQWLGILVEYV